MASETITTNMHQPVLLGERVTALARARGVDANALTRSFLEMRWTIERVHDEQRQGGHSGGVFVNDIPLGGAVLLQRYRSGGSHKVNVKMPTIRHKKLVKHAGEAGESRSRHINVATAMGVEVIALQPNPEDIFAPVRVQVGGESIVFLV